MALAHRDISGLLKKHGYTEIRKIGEGSFGKALLVQSEDGTKLVCKMVDVSQASAKETQDAVKEGRLLAQFRHPYVVRYRDNFIDSGWLSILMDYCEGGDLSKQIENARKRRQPIPEEQILMWITQALLALKYIHDKHVLHRDLKSSNFFLSKSGNLKMGDFGIAKVLACTAACAKTQIGTPYYLSPEVCQEKPYTWPSDMWAMGCILYELCALRVPFDANSISDLVKKICRGPTPSIPSGYSDFLRQLCTEMLNRNPTSRPSAESILARPQMQSVVKQMLERAQAAQEGRDPALSGGGGVSEAAAPAARHSLPASVGSPHPAPEGGFYRKGDPVEYHSTTHKDWLPATVLNVDSEYRIIIDLKPNTWISRELQAVQIRPRRRSVENAHAGPAVGCPTPLRQQSPSVVGAAPRAMTPSRLREASPWLGGGAGSRQPSPQGRRLQSREPSPAIGSRAPTPGNASTPGRASSPRGGYGAQRYDPVGARPAADLPQGPPRGPPGMPRGPLGHSPLGGQPRRPFNAAGLAIAGGV
mmetsp:Transcript_107227/g.260330  ORF Transcript_107227/g.260330 Transcript_107227/m.260330 type:complete len:531 (-) Transcript_107227:133-1725(-)